MTPTLILIGHTRHDMFCIFGSDGYYVASKPITPLYLVYVNSNEFIHFHSSIIFVIKSMSIFNDLVYYDEIII